MLPTYNVNEAGLCRRNQDLHQKILRDLATENIFECVTKQ